MGCFGKCTCCLCFPVEDLPTVTISGYTGAGWTGDCCFEQIFTPNTTPSWVKSCSALLYEGSVFQECTTNHLRQTRGSYRGFEYGPLGDCSDVPEDYCCGGAYASIATTVSTSTHADNAFMAVWRRVKNIAVQISQEVVNCDDVEGQTGGCKFVIRSRYVYEYISAIYQNGITTGSQTVTMENDDCFEVNPDYVFSSGGGSPITCSDVPSSPPAGGSGSNLCLNSGEFYFDRVRYYDEFPTGSVEFTNANVPGCTASSCDYEPYNYLASVCINSPSNPSAATGCFFNEPCYCTDEPTPTGPVIVHEPENCFYDGLSQIQNVTDLSGCFDDPCVTAISCVTTLTNCSTEAYECPGTGFLMNCLDFESNPENEATCFRAGVGLYSPSACGCAFSIQGQAGREPPYFDVSDCFVGNCNPLCCDFLDDCPCCLPDGRCLSGFTTFYYQTVETHTRTQTCSGLSSRSVCTGAPTWTISLA